MTTTDKPSIAELKRIDAAGYVREVYDAVPVLLEIAAAGKALELELAYLIGPLSERLRAALAKVRP